MISDFSRRPRPCPLCRPHICQGADGNGCCRPMQEGFPQCFVSVCLGFVPQGWWLTWLSLRWTAEDSSADLRNTTAALGKSAVFVVWGFEASFTTETGSGQMCSRWPAHFPAHSGADHLPTGPRRGALIAHPVLSLLSFFGGTFLRSQEVRALFWGVRGPGTPPSRPGILSRRPLDFFLSLIWGAQGSLWLL